MTGPFDQHDQLEIEQIITDMRLKNRQHATEIRKVVLAAFTSGAAVTLIAAVVARLVLGVETP